MASDVGTRSMINFTAPWCGGCKALKPLLSEVSKKVSLVTYDIEIDPGKAAEFHVSSLPTVVFMDGGREVGRVSGNSTNTQASIKNFGEGR
jgi:thiol-disulfide isomerase/thioredoxin